MKLEGGQIKKISALYQIILWLFFYFVFYHAFFDDFNLEYNFINFLVYSIVFVCYIPISIFHTKILLPHFFEKKKYIIYLISLISSLVTIAFILNYFIIFTLKIEPIKDEKILLSWVGFLFFFGLLFIGLGSFFHFFANWHYLRENLIIHEKEKINSELTALKAQINPHFLFNMLNNIYSMSLEKSDRTPQVVLKLSDLMSYVLYDCKKEKVSIRDEIEFQENYLQLERIRFEDNIEIKNELDLQLQDVEIAPLIFLPFIENAFKHVSNLKNEKPYISISLSLNSDRILIFKAENSFFDSENIQKSPYSGIGIQNVTKRLSYLYPDKYKLEISNKNNNYLVYLKIEL